MCSFYTYLLLVEVIAKITYITNSGKENEYIITDETFSLFK